MGTGKNDTIYHKAIIINGNVMNDVVISTDQGWFDPPGATYNYDNLFDEYKNPFKRIAFVFQLFNLYPYDPLEIGGYSFVMARSENNIVTSKFNFIIQPIIAANYYEKDYIYNANGLPISASFTKHLFQEDRSYYGKELYFYTK